MSDYDKQRIENAIWVLFQYQEQIEDIIKDSDTLTFFALEEAFDTLNAIKEEL